jgi:uncharacterized tellurite resistance protein B-like protein
MEQKPTILQGYTDMEKGAYLGAIASIATADRTATDEEVEFIEALCLSADLSEAQEAIVKRAATEMTEEDLKRCLDVLKGSELRFSLVSDMIAFSQADQNYSEAEKHSVEKVATYLGVNQQQFSVLDEFTKKAVEEVPQHAEKLQTSEESPSHILGGLGFGDKLKGAGINSNALLKGAIGVIGPIILAQMFRGGRTRGGGMFGGGSGGIVVGLLGGVLGGGGMGGMLGGGSGTTRRSGGLFDILGGGRGFGSAGGLLGKILGR